MSISDRSPLEPFDGPDGPFITARHEAEPLWSDLDVEATHRLTRMR
jgi:hypothetical protein